MSAKGNCAWLFGVPIAALTEEQLVRIPGEVARSGGRCTVMYANVHVLNQAYVDTELRAALRRADLLYCDGAGVKLGARVLGYRLPARMTGADWIHPFCRNAEAERLRLYVLAGQPGVAERACAELRARYPRLQIAGCRHGYLGESWQTAEAIEDINRACPDVLMVGMGTPEQERWIAANRAEIQTPVCWTVGALFDYVAGIVPRGPRWMLDHGLEWAFRLWLEPRRMGRRYLIGNPLFVFRVVMQLMTEGRGGREGGNESSH